MAKQVGKGSIFKFVATDGAGIPPKRQQTARACDSCRRRKKRCHHTDFTPRLTSIDTRGDYRTSQTHSSPTSPDTTLSQTTHIDRERSGQGEQEQTRDQNVVLGHSELPGHHVNHHQGQDNHVIAAANNESCPGRSHNVPPDGGNSRYIGDMSPEAIFAAATNADTTRGQSLDESIGIWLTTKPNGFAQGSSPALQTPSNIFYGSGSIIQKVMVPMLEQECLSTIPSSQRVEALCKIYFEKVHPILPIVDQHIYEALDHASPERVLLRQGMCLAASKNFSARHLLVLNDSEALLTSRQFGDRISSAMRLSMEMGLVTSKLVTIQALALMSQFTDTPAGEHLPPQYCGKAVLHAQIIGLHIRGQQEEAKEKGRTTLFCCIWAIDRMDAAFNGRAVLIHERDVSHDLERCFEQQEPCFRLFLAVIKLLDTVIDLYRPVSTSSEAAILSQEFPAFEDIVMSCDCSHIGTSALATIETLYHAIAILSSRTKTWVDPQRSSISYLRQSLSTTILSSTSTRDLQSQLILFPFVPYALSLSLSVTYREMRHSKLPSHRARSQVQFQTICDALSELEGIFVSASSTSEMGRKLLKEMDRVFTVVSSSESRRDPTANTPTNGYPHQNASNNLPTPNEQPVIPFLGLQDFDPSIFDQLADVDLFGMFDPAFDLDGFDACLEGNLNPAFPTNFQ